MTAQIEVRDYRADDQPHFERINLQWIERYFTVEPVDERVLRNPEGGILAAGGHILVAELGGEVAGTAALRHEGDGHFELTKMAVDEGHQGQGVGRALLDAAIRRFRETGGTLLSLESDSSLAVAIGMYERAGFRHEPRLRPSEYDRADVYMVYRGPFAVK